jgi:hypothetical protein
MTKTPTHMSAGRDYNHPLHGRYEYVLFADDETIVARQSGFSNKAKAVKAGYLMAASLTPDTALEGV